MALFICRRFLFSFLIVGLVVVLSATCHAALSGSFLITHAPTYMKFLHDAKPMLSSEIPDLVNSAFGFNIPRDLKWNGLQQSSLFEKPRASMIISVVGYDELSPLTLTHQVRYSLKADDPVLITESVAGNLERHSDSPLIVDFSVDNTMFDVRSRHPHLFAKLPATFDDVRNVIANGASAVTTPSNISDLDINVDSDLLFLGELHVIEEIVNALKTHHHSVQSAADFYHFTISGFAKVLAAHGIRSTQATNARLLLQTVLNKVTADLRQLYQDNVLIQVVTLPNTSDALIRKSRSLLADPTPEPAPKPTGPVGGLSTNYGSNYPVAFNIILWLMIVLSLIVLAVSYGIWHMDPGRDSIIYRMTSQRLKLD